MMATASESMHEVEEASLNQNSFLLSASCRIFQDFPNVYINPLESISVDVESPRLQFDSNSETPDKYPNAPHPSPTDVQNGPDISIFNAELIKCLSNLPVFLLSSEENTKNDSPEKVGFHTEDHVRSHLEASSSTDQEMRSDCCKHFLDHYENVDESCSLKTNFVTLNGSNHFEKDGKNEKTKHFQTNVNNAENMDLLNVESFRDFNPDFSCRRRNTFSDNESTIANCASDVSDISLEDVEFVPSDNNSSCELRHRIEFEALALDSAIHPCIFQSFQHWKTRSKNKRALSLDEMNPLHKLQATHFSKTEFELSI